MIDLNASLTCFWISEQNKIFNSTKPFGNPIIKDLIQSLWFGNGKTKADTGTKVQIVKNGEIPLMILFLVTSAVSFQFYLFLLGTTLILPCHLLIRLSTALESIGMGYKLRLFLRSV